MKLMLSPRYDESSCQSYELLYHLIRPAKNVKSLNDCWSDRDLRSKMVFTTRKKSIIFEKVWINETREEVYIAEYICQVSKVYDYPRQMRETQ